MSATSEAQIAANLANAQLSTGPRTGDGKQRSSQNAVRHALFAKTLPARDQEASQRLLAQYQQDLHPQGAVEEQFVLTIADTQWRLTRCRELQQALLFAETETPDQQLDALNKYSLYEQRLARILQSTVKQLQEIQYDRCEREQSEMRQAARIHKNVTATGAAYDPAEDGFVFSAAEFAQFLRRDQHTTEVSWEHSRRFFANQSAATRSW
jgi:hypothetical protein